MSVLRTCEIRAPNRLRQSFISATCSDFSTPWRRNKGRASFAVAQKKHLPNPVSKPFELAPDIDRMDVVPAVQPKKEGIRSKSPVPTAEVELRSGSTGLSKAVVVGREAKFKDKAHRSTDPPSNSKGNCRASWPATVPPPDCPASCLRAAKTALERADGSGGGDSHQTVGRCLGWVIVGRGGGERDCLADVCNDVSNGGENGGIDDDQKGVGRGQNRVDEVVGNACSSGTKAATMSLLANQKA